MKKLNNKAVQAAAPAEKGKKFRLPLSAYLGYLLVACLLVMGVTFSGYVSSAGGSDSARVAKFKVTGTGTLFQDITADIAPGETVVRTVSVKNDSETTIRCFIDLTNQAKILPLTFSSTAGNAGTLVGMNETKEFAVEIIWDKSIPENCDPKYAGLVDQVQISLIAEQAD